MSSTTGLMGLLCPACPLPVLCNGSHVNFADWSCHLPKLCLVHPTWPTPSCLVRGLQRWINVPMKILYLQEATVKDEEPLNLQLNTSVGRFSGVAWKLARFTGWFSGWHPPVFRLSENRCENLTGISHPSGTPTPEKIQKSWKLGRVCPNAFLGFQH